MPKESNVLKHCIDTCVSIGTATSTFGGKTLPPDISAACSVQLSSGTLNFVASLVRQIRISMEFLSLKIMASNRNFQIRVAILMSFT
jgi:hypothetical protein